MTSIRNYPRVSFSVTNCICYDQRVLKMAEIVSKLGANVTIIGRKGGKCCETNDILYKTKRFRMIFKKGFLFYKFFNVRLFFFLLFHRYEILVANDLDTLLPNYFVSRIRKLQVVFDSHEYFTGVPELENRSFVKWIWKAIEKTVMPRLKFTMTVSSSIAEQYYSEYGIKPLVVRNCSRRSENIQPYSKEKLGIDPDHLLVILQGTGINAERGGEELIDSLLLYDKVSLLIIGTGGLLPSLQEKVLKTGLSARVNFFPRVPWEEMMRFTRTADVGVSLDKKGSFNQRFSLPNKLFDYISAGIPVIAGDLPEVTKIITHFNCGILLPEINPGEISQAVKLLRENFDLLNRLKKNSKEAAEILTWEKESIIVKEFYTNILSII